MHSSMLNCDEDKYHAIRQSDCSKGHHPNDFLRSARCFVLGQFLKDKHEIAMSIMKYSIQAPTLMQNWGEHEFDVKDFKEHVHSDGPLPRGAKHDIEY